MKALYEQVYESLKQEIISAKYNIGDQVPSEKELSESFQVSRITSKKALEKLMNEGYVYRQRGKGTFVANFTNKPLQQSKYKKPLFGLVVTKWDDSYGSGLVLTMEGAANDKCMIITKSSFGIPEQEDKIVKELLDFGVDGLIIFPAQAEHYSSEILKMVVDKFPLVLIDRSFKGIAATSVSTDNRTAAKMGIDYLFELGHEQVGVLMPAAYETTTIEDRLDGIVNAFAEKNVVVNRELWCSDIKSTLPTPQAARAKDIEAIKDHIKKYPQMTALFALEYNIALLAKKAVEQLGLRVPQDISIICFDSPPWSELQWNFTHLKQNEEELGRLSIKRMLDMYQGESEIKQDRIPASLRIGQTTAPIQTRHLSS